MSQETDPHASTPAEARVASGSPSPSEPRQFINFSFYRLDPAFRRLSPVEKARAREEFLSAAKPPDTMICLSYSLAGLRADADLMLWRISYNSDDLQSHSAAINRSTLGAYLETPYSFLSMSKRSVYIDRIDPGHSQSRARIVPGRGKFIFVYPFVKTRQWYLLPLQQRQAMMDEHVAVGNKYPTVKLNTTYSFGLDDQEFVVAFETDEPKDFLDLVMELRETQASLYTLRDTPVFTCVRKPVDQILAELF